jgi:hypothetical protein
MAVQRRKVLESKRKHLEREKDAGVTTGVRPLMSRRNTTRNTKENQYQGKYAILPEITLQPIKKAGEVDPKYDSGSIFPRHNTQAHPSDHTVSFSTATTISSRLHVVPLESREEAP